MRIDVHAAARVGLAMVDRHLRFVDVNQALAALDGIGAAEQVGRHIRDVLPSGLADEAIPVADADPDAVIGVGAVVEDITEHRAAERRTAHGSRQVLLSVSAAPRRQGRRGDRWTSRPGPDPRGRGQLPGVALRQRTITLSGARIRSPRSAESRMAPEGDRRSHLGCR